MESAKYIEVAAEVRYWEDATLNGKEDTDGQVPLRQGALWVPVIEWATGRILDWPMGLEARIHYKVCDAGEYWLLDSNRQRIAKWAGYYVPDDVLCVGSRGYGDYIIFRVNTEGAIVGWNKPWLDPERWTPCKTQ